jgi:aspartyl/asparaginyl beta-hydroxylase (cupin superfamily)
MGDGASATTRYWEAGKDLLFDDNKFHHVHNLTPQRRVILLVDVVRDYESVFINFLNHLALRFVAFNPAITDFVGRQERFHKEGVLENAPPLQ